MVAIVSHEDRSGISIQRDVTKLLELAVDAAADGPRTLEFSAGVVFLHASVSCVQDVNKP